MRVSLLSAVALSLVVVPPGISLELQKVPVGDPGNPADSIAVPGLGEVGYRYEIGMYEVTNAEFAEFLNAVAPQGDPTGLWNPHMGDTPEGGIERLGSGTVADPYLYAAVAPLEDKPVNYVSWEDAARFANWLEAGQPRAPCDACTEFESYDLALGTPRPRNPGARWVLPSADEWYKAAFYEERGGAAGYWLYPTRSNSLPSIATCSFDGDAVTALENAANFDFGCHWNEVVGNVATVGTSGRNSFYGTFDQAGNVEELLEDGSARGGDFFNGPERIAATGLPFLPLSEEKGVGFRVVFVPEPSCAALEIAALLATTAVAWTRRRLDAAGSTRQHPLL